MINNTRTIISIPELVARWGLSKQYIWLKCKNGEFPGKKIGTRWFVDTEWVLETEKNGTQAPKNTILIDGTAN